MSRNLIFYDTETTGIHKDFSQIIQCGSIFTDNTLKVLDEQNIGSKPLPWIIPQPKACFLIVHHQLYPDFFLTFYVGFFLTDFVCDNRQLLSFLLIVGLLLAIIAAANRAALIAPSSPIAKVPTGIPLGI